MSQPELPAGPARGRLIVIGKSCTKADHNNYLLEAEFVMLNPDGSDVMRVSPTNGNSYPVKKKLFMGISGQWGVKNQAKFLGFFGQTWQDWQPGRVYDLIVEHKQDKTDPSRWWCNLQLPQAPAYAPQQQSSTGQYCPPQQQYTQQPVPVAAPPVYPQVPQVGQNPGQVPQSVPAQQYNQQVDNFTQQIQQEFNGTVVPPPTQGDWDNQF